MLKWITFFVSFILLLISSPGYASHLLGAEISYRYLDTLKYEVIVKYYRDCRGIPLNVPSLMISCDGLNRDTVFSTRTSIQDITPVCKASIKLCNPSNVRSGDGVERHIYKDTLDFNSTKYNNLRNCGGKIRISVTSAARSYSINTGVSGGLYTYALLDLKNFPKNSSPELTSNPSANFCCYQPVFYNIGARDTFDYDSLSYSWARPLRDWNTSLNYTGSSYAYNSPFLPYYPGYLGPPFQNINAKPPIGLYLDPETGDLIFTPTRCDEITVAVIEVKEWRKDTNGIYQEIGLSRRDMTFVTKNCRNNNPPEINGPFSYEVCEGNELCFDVRTDDERYIPPPPAQAPDPDTVTISWNEGIPQATFTILNDSARLQTGRFCWTPDSGMARGNPYSFAVTARDNACPRNSVAVRGFRVRVKPRAKSQRVYEKKSCNWYQVSTSVDSTFQGHPSFRWLLLDSNRNIVFDKYTAAFRSTGNFISTRQTDSIKFYKPGRYIIQHGINNLPVNCPETYFDTIEVSVNSPNYVKLGLSDTIICPGQDVIISGEVKGNKQQATFHWFLNDSLLAGLDSLKLNLVNYNSDTVNSYKITMTDGEGCKSSDQFNIENYVLTEVDLGPVQEKCLRDTIFLEIDSSLTNITWSPPSLQLYRPYFLSSDSVFLTYKDSNACAGTAKTEVRFLRLPEGQLKDTSFCNANGSIYAGSAAIYRWNTGSYLPRIKTPNTAMYTVELTDTNGCKNRDSAFVEVFAPEQVVLPGDVRICDSFRLKMPTTGHYQWSNGESGSQLLITKKQTLGVNYTDTNGCESTDTMFLDILQTDKVDLMDSVLSCGPYTFTLKPSGSYRWSNGGVLNTNTIQNSKNVWVNHTDSSGCPSSDTSYVNVVITPIPVLTQSGDSIKSNITGKHLWFLDGQRTEEDQPSVAINGREGFFSAIYVNRFGCESDTSSGVEILLGVENLTADQIRVYPNPSSGRVMIEGLAIGTIKQVKLFDAQGRVVNRELDISRSTAELRWVSSPGVYVVEVTTDLGIFRKTIIQE